MLDGDDSLSLPKDHVTPPPKPFFQAQRVLCRPALFAMEDSGGSGDGEANNTSRRGSKGGGRKGHGQPLVYGQMKDILASGRRSTKTIKGNGDGLCADDEEEDDNDVTIIPSFLDRYDGSLASLKTLMFPSTSTDRPIKRLFDAAVLSSTSPAKWMTATELDIVLDRLSKEERVRCQR